MIALSFLLVVAALGLLVTGLVGASQVLIWASIAASIAAGCCLAVAVMQQRRFQDVDDTADVVAPPGYGARPDEPTTIITPVAGEPAREPAGVEPPPPPPESWHEPPAPPVPEPDGAGAVAEGDFPTGALPTDEDTGQYRGHSGHQEDPVDEPPEEDVAPGDVLRTADLPYDVLVVDGRPRYHLVDCSHLHARDAVSLPLAEAREAGFTPCSRCRPDSTLAARARERFG